MPALTDPLNGAADAAFALLGSGLHHPLMYLGLPLLATSTALSLVVRWARRAVR